MGSRVGMEVPIIGSDQLKWIEVSIPSSSSSSLPSLPPIAATYTETDEDSSYSSRNTFAPFTEDCASCHIIGDPSTYLIWRIHKSLPNTIEVMELTACNEVPRIGLRLIFPDALSPFAFICKDETSNSIRNPYLLYTLTVSGVAYLFKLRSVSEYVSCSIFPQNEFIEFYLQTLSQSAPITAVTATSGCLVVGRHDASVACFQLGVLNTSAQGFMHELRDDVGIGRLWGLMGRGRTVAPVQDIVIAELHGRKVIFVVHVDGSLRIWDLLSHTKLLSHTISSATSTGNLHFPIMSATLFVD
ncbi:Nuclear pore complex protein [Thalictrum thalictroides]|uniref:Nuclear pore complex protein n=1 Tax=Thalictrum thalictroides TaxID=46969 RepID=A0A7J6V7P1_THATH|nr:Nuclear pore complex protein [Thalictrum thalictroides]